METQGSGGRVSRRFTPSVGVGVMFRVSKATVYLDPRGTVRGGRHTTPGRSVGGGGTRDKGVDVRVSGQETREGVHLSSHPFDVWHSA